MLDEWGRFGGISLNPPTFSEKWVNLTGYKIVRNVRKIIKYGEEYLLAKRGDRLERFPKISMLEIQSHKVVRFRKAIWKVSFES